LGHIAGHDRRSIRLKGYDYTRDGAYFVTLCVQNREVGALREAPLLFGTVVDGEMRLNEYGRQVAACWLWLAKRYPYVHLDQWVVMPDHVHGIIVIADDHGGGGSGRGGSGRGGSRTAPTGQRDVTAGQTKRKPLGRLIGAFKTVSTKRINGIRSTPGAQLWQRGYYEHIVRDERSLQRIRAYIANNPSRWEPDRGTGVRFIDHPPAASSTISSS
jgi:putative transposase